MFFWEAFSEQLMNILLCFPNYNGKFGAVDPLQICIMLKLIFFVHRIQQPILKLQIMNVHEFF